MKMQTVIPSKKVLIREQMIALGVVLICLVGIYYKTAWSIVTIWNSSETFAHGYIIAPIVAWMIWSKRAELAGIPSKPYWPALIALVACGAAWMLADLADVQVVRQYAFVAMLPICTLMVLGLEITRVIAFPLIFLLLAVPFGEIFIDPLINFTADFTVAAVELTGIPILREGANFSLPSGNWSVVEACSGVRYLIASFTLGCLYAYVTYQSWLRRLVFILASIIVPIIANGLRAFIIVMIGHFSGMELAVGADHLIYGWVFFGLIMFLMFWTGSLWREEKRYIEGDEGTRMISTSTVQYKDKRTLYLALLSALVCIMAWPIYTNYIEHKNVGETPVQLDSFQSDWKESSSFTTWKPSFSSPNKEIYRFYQSGNDRVGFQVMYYRNQKHSTKMISSVNRMVDEEDALWRKIGSNIHHEKSSSLDLTVRETMIQGESGRVLVWNWYWIDGRYTTNHYLAKLLQAKGMLLLHGDDGAVITIFAPYEDRPEEARIKIRKFLNTNFDPLEATLNNNLKV